MPYRLKLLKKNFNSIWLEDRITISERPTHTCKFFSCSILSSSSICCIPFYFLKNHIYIYIYQKRLCIEHIEKCAFCLIRCKFYVHFSFSRIIISNEKYKIIVWNLITIYFSCLSNTFSLKYI